jgi:hypothetical protein
MELLNCGFVNRVVGWQLENKVVPHIKKGKKRYEKQIPYRDIRRRWLRQTVVHSANGQFT